MKRYLISLSCIFFLFSSPLYAKDRTAAFLAVSDIHFDPYLACEPKATTCITIDKLLAAPVPEWNVILETAQPDAPKIGQDTNVKLLHETMAELKFAAQTNRARFVILLGDFLAHNYRDKYFQYATEKTQEAFSLFTRKTFEYLTQEVNTALPNINVYSVIGNNDSYSGHNDLSTLEPLVKDLTQIWSQQLRDRKSRFTFQDQFKNAGYFSLRVPGDDSLVLIGLNTNLFSASVNKDEADAKAKEQLKFLHEQLMKARYRRDKVLILMHISDNINVFNTITTGQTRPFWHTEYSDAFKAELKQFESNISGVIAGHVHLDWFGLLGNIPMPSVSSISPEHNNPGYKVFNYSLCNKNLTNYQTYFYDLNLSPRWQFEYDFNQTYQRGCRDCKLINGMYALTSTSELKDSYIKYYQISGKNEITPDLWKYIWCNINYQSVVIYEQCLAETA